MLSHDPLGRFLQRTKPIYGFLGAVIVFGLTESLLIPLLGHYPSLSTLQPKDLWVRIASIFTNFFVSPIGWAYYISILNLPEQVAADLQSKQVIKPTARKQLLKWKDDYEKELGNRYLAIAVFLIPGTIVAIIVRGWLFDFEPWFGRNNPVHFVFASMTTFFQFYAYIWILIRELLAIKWMARLFHDNKDGLVLYPSHPDHAGGLSIIGRHVNKLVAFVVIFGLQYAFYTYFVILYKIPYNIVSLSVILGWIVYMMLVPLSFFPFVLPAHHFMKEYKDRKLLGSAQNISRVIYEIEKQNIAVTHESMENLENLKKYLDFIEKELPVWPFGASILRQISISSLIPVLNFVASIVLNYFVK